MARPGCWNHNTHYHRVVIDAVGATAARVLDLGCGDGLLTRELGAPGRTVIGIDQDAPSVERAVAQFGARPGVEFVHGDAMTHEFEPHSFDAVVAVAFAHHVGIAAALQRMVDLARPGGAVALIGLARSTEPRDVAIDAAAVVASRLYRLRRGYWEHDAPTVWPTPESYADVRAAAAAIVPGAIVRRRLLFRYTLSARTPTRTRSRARE